MHAYDIQILHVFILWTIHLCWVEMGDIVNGQRLLFLWINAMDFDKLGWKVNNCDLDLSLFLS